MVKCTAMTTNTFELDRRDNGLTIEAAEPGRATVFGGRLVTNWQRDGTAGSYSELVPPGDAVLFDDTLVSNPTVSLTSGLWPLSVTVSNNNTNYVFGGSGRLSGGGSLTKLGAARLAITTWWSATPSAP